MKETVAAKEALDDLIIRLERDLAFQNVRLENCKEPTGTFANYLRTRIQVIGVELTRVRKERIKHYGKIKESPKLPHRISFNPKTSSMSASRLDDARKAKQRRNSRKPKKNRD